MSPIYIHDPDYTETPNREQFFWLTNTCPLTMSSETLCRPDNSPRADFSQAHLQDVVWREAAKPSALQSLCPEMLSSGLQCFSLCQRSALRRQIFSISVPL